MTVAANAGTARSFSAPQHGAPPLIERFSETQELLRRSEANLATAQDITDRKKTEQALELSRASFRNVIESSMDGMLIVDKGGTVQFANRAAEIFFCTPAKTLKGTRLDLPVGRSGQISNIDIRCANGDEGKGEIYATETEWNGEPVLMVAIRDVTETKRTEESLRRHQAQLEHALAELKGIHQQIIQYERLSALGQMASGIAHDFNNLLMPILGMSEFMLLNPDTLDDRKDSVEMLEMIHSAAMQARDVVKRLREFYRPDESVKMAPVNLHKLVSEAVVLTRPKWIEEARSRSAKIEIETDLAELLPVPGNESALRDVFMNLILNAVDAMPEGGKISIKGECREGWVAVTVADTGKGMSEEVVRRCIEPFFTTKGKQGTGLGLSVVHGIVQRHGGTLEIRSQPGKGTCFSIRLPGEQKTAEPPQKKTGTRWDTIPKVRVLIVEDELTSRQTLARYLTVGGFAFETAASGPEGLEKIRAGRFDLVILDRSMPGMSGSELARAIKQVSPGTSIIMVTGFGQAGSDESERPEEVSAMLTKPVTESELREAMASVFPP